MTNAPPFAAALVFLIAYLICTSIARAQFDAAMATNVADSYYGWRTVALEVYSGIVEKAQCASVPTNDWPDPPGWFGQRATGLEYKTFIGDELAPRYIDYSVTNVAGQYYASNAGAFFVTYTASSLCAFAGVQHDYLDKHGWFDWQSTNSWQHFADVLNPLRWTWDFASPILRASDRPTVYPDPPSGDYEDAIPYGSNTTYHIERAVESTSYAADPKQAVTNFYIAWTNTAALGVNNRYQTNDESRTTSCGFAPSHPGSYYGVWASVVTNMGPGPPNPFTNTMFRGGRYHGWTWLDALTTNYAHEAEIYGFVESWKTNQQPLACVMVSNEYAQGDSPLWYQHEFRIMTAVGSEATTNYRAPATALGTNLAIFETFLLPIRNAENPLVVLGVDDSTPYYHDVIVGVRVEWTNTYFLMKWDTNPTTGMQYIF